jgi:hypothetical protein
VVDVEGRPLLARHEAEPLSQFVQERLDAVDDRLLDVALAPRSALVEAELVARSSWPVSSFGDLVDDPPRAERRDLTPQPTAMSRPGTRDDLMTQADAVP